MSHRSWVRSPLGVSLHGTDAMMLHPHTHAPHPTCPSLHPTFHSAHLLIFPITLRADAHACALPPHTSACMQATPHRHQHSCHHFHRTPHIATSRCHGAGCWHAWSAGRVRVGCCGRVLARSHTDAMPGHTQGRDLAHTHGGFGGKRQECGSVRARCVRARVGVQHTGLGWQRARGRRWRCQAVLAHPHGTPRAHTTPVGCRTRHHGATSIRRPAPCTHLTHQPMPPCFYTVSRRAKPCRCSYSSVVRAMVLWDIGSGFDPHWE